MVMPAGCGKSWPEAPPNRGGMRPRSYPKGDRNRDQPQEVRQRPALGGSGWGAGCEQGSVALPQAGV